MMNRLTTDNTPVCGGIYCDNPATHTRSDYPICDACGITELKPRHYSPWDMSGNRRQRIGDDCYNAYTSSGDEQFLKAACRIDELEERLRNVANPHQFMVYMPVGGHGFSSRDRFDVACGKRLI